MTRRPREGRRSVRTALRVAYGIGLVGLLAATGSAQTIEKKTLSFEAATKVAAAAEAAARTKGVGVVIVVVDDGGHVILLHRLDDTQARA